MELEKLYSDRISALETALRQKDEMVKDLEEQNKNMVSRKISKIYPERKRERERKSEVEITC